jgi:hypothetical protein
MNKIFLALVFGFFLFAKTATAGLPDEDLDHSTTMRTLFLTTCYVETVKGWTRDTRKLSSREKLSEFGREGVDKFFSELARQLTVASFKIDTSKVGRCSIKGENDDVIVAVIVDAVYALGRENVIYFQLDVLPKRLGIATKRERMNGIGGIGPEASAVAIAKWLITGLTTTPETAVAVASPE